MSRWFVRGRLVLGRNLVPVVAALAVLALVGGVLTYGAHVDPGTETELIEEASWSSTGEYTHQAAVTVDTPVFDRGEVLRNRASYFAAVTPVLNGSFVYAYQATDGGELQVTANQTLVLRSVSEPDGPGGGSEQSETVEYWRLEEPLGSAEASATPGERVRVPFEFNVTRAIVRLETIEETLGGTPGETEIAVRSDVSITGTRNGEPVDVTRQYDMQINANGNVYSVEEAGPQQESGQQFREETVEASSGPLLAVGAPLLLLVSLVGCLGLAVGRWRGTFAVSDAERTWLAYTSTYREFEDWISTGRIPDGALTGPAVSLDTLEGLVDVAIDSNRRVLEDRSRGICVVLLDDAVYTYEIPAAVVSGDRTDPLATPPEPAGTTDGPATRPEGGSAPADAEAADDDHSES